MEMTREQALKTATQNWQAHMKADLEQMRGQRDEFNAFQEFGYRHGWYCVNGNWFNVEDITGEAYNADQGGWAYV